MRFGQFIAAYEDIVRRARDGKLTAEDFAGVTISLTNPGTIGTVHSVPRLMRGQGAIIGAGAMEYPAEFQGASEERISDLGVGKLITLTSTYDHRIIQGAESGDFLRTIHELLLADEFFDEIFRELGHPVRAGALAHRQSGLDRRQERPRHRADRGLPQPRSPDGRHRPAAAGQDPLPQPPRPRRAQPRPDAVGPGPRVQGRRLRRLPSTRSCATCWGCCATPTAAMSASSTPTSSSPNSSSGCRNASRSSRTSRRWPNRSTSCRKLNAAEAFETFLATKYVGQKRFSLEGAETVIPMMDAAIDQAPSTGSTRSSSACRTAAGSTCWPTSSASRTRRSSPSSRAT